MEHLKAPLSRMLLLSHLEIKVGLSWGHKIEAFLCPLCYPSPTGTLFASCGCCNKFPQIPLKSRGRQGSSPSEGLVENPCLFQLLTAPVSRPLAD